VWQCITNKKHQNYYATVLLNVDVAPNTKLTIHPHKIYPNKSLSLHHLLPFVSVAQSSGFAAYISISASTWQSYGTHYRRDFVPYCFSVLNEWWLSCWCLLLSKWLSVTNYHIYCVCCIVSFQPLTVHSNKYLTLSPTVVKVTDISKFTRKLLTTLNVSRRVCHFITSTQCIIVTVASLSNNKPQLLNRYNTTSMLRGQSLASTWCWQEITRDK